tara:strand:- start:175 stop:297 length:123 start_codon:yes stop_codon:yes gene_type:complete
MVKDGKGLGRKNPHKPQQRKKVILSLKEKLKRKRNRKLNR